MARIGLRYFRHAPLTNEALTYNASTYGTIATLAGAIECKVSLDVAEATLYADDILKEKVSVVSQGTITLGIDEDDDAKMAALLGQTSKELTIQGETGAKEYVQKADDTPVPQGFGHIVPKMVSGSRKYKVEFFPKVLFKPYAVDAKTKGDSLEFTTPSIEGTVMPLEDGTWEIHATFEKEESAKTYLDSLFNQQS